MAVSTPSAPFGGGRRRGAGGLRAVSGASFVLRGAVWVGGGVLGEGRSGKTQASTLNCDHNKKKGTIF